MGIERKTKITSEVKGISCEKALKLILNSLNPSLGILARKGKFLYVSTKDDIATLVASEAGPQSHRRISSSDPLFAQASKKIEFPYIKGSWSEILYTIDLFSDLKIIKDDSALEHAGIDVNSDLDGTDLSPFRTRFPAIECLWLANAWLNPNIGWMPYDSAIFVSTNEKIAAMQSDNKR